MIPKHILEDAGFACNPPRDDHHHKRHTDPMTEAAEKRPVGRPSDYDPAYCERVIELGREGKSRAEIASDLDCSRQTLANWERQHAEFLDALQRAKDEELAWWEAAARKGLTQGSSFNAAIWSKSVNGRFPNEPYRERSEITGAGGVPLSPGVVTIFALPSNGRDSDT